MKKTINLTPAGKSELENELAELIAQRPAIAERIATARAFGDLSENQEYTDARAEQKTVENRILEIQETLKNAAIIKTPRKSDKVSIGATVEITMSGKKFTYTVVGPVEANQINDVAWDGGWYMRALSKEENIGSKYSEGSKIYLNAQTWAVLADVVDDEERLQKLVKSVDDMEYDFGFPLNLPPYLSYSPHVGRMSGMLDRKSVV